MEQQTPIAIDTYSRVDLESLAWREREQMDLKANNLQLIRQQIQILISREQEEGLDVNTTQENE